VQQCPVTCFGFASAKKVLALKSCSLGCVDSVVVCPGASSWTTRKQTGEWSNDSDFRRILPAVQHAPHSAYPVIGFVVDSEGKRFASIRR
jgi:hypothetical protein